MLTEKSAKFLDLRGRGKKAASIAKLDGCTTETTEHLIALINNQPCLLLDAEVHYY